MKKTILIILIALIGISIAANAQGDILITPYRVVLDGKKQKEEINIANTGKDTAVYSISFLQKKMNEDGSFENIDQSESNLMFADKYVRIFPRTVTLGPGESQVIVIQFDRKMDMLAGEYRSHLYFRAENKQIPLGMESTILDPNNLSVQLIPVYGMTIPIIIRNGKVNVNSSLTNLKLGKYKDNSQKLSLTINRTGNCSTYGDLNVEFIPKKGKSIQVGTINGIAVYTSIDKRNVDIKLDNVNGKQLKDGKLKVQYKTSDQKKETVYAEEILEL